MLNRKNVLIVIIILVVVSELGFLVKNKKSINQLEQAVILLEENNATYSRIVETLQKEKIENVEKILILDEKIQELEEKNETITDKTREQSLLNSIQENQSLREQYIVVPIYSANVDTNEKEIRTYITISKETSLEEKLNIISEKLSKYHYSNLPIEFLRFEYIGGKKIAIINLQEFVENKVVTEIDDAKGRTWRYHYFQGTTFGAAISMNLIETFLQREYYGEWIDGVKFIYENNPDARADHVESLFEINYR
jgi:hypothetical protein